MKAILDVLLKEKNADAWISLLKELSMVVDEEEFESKCSIILEEIASFKSQSDHSHPFGLWTLTFYEYSSYSSSPNQSLDQDPEAVYSESMRSYSDRDQLSQIVMMIAPDGRVRMDRLSATPLKPDIQPWETDTSEEEEEPWEGRTRWWFFENEDLRDYVEDGDGFEPDDGSLRAKAPIPATPSGNAVLLDLDGYGLHGGDSREYFDSISWIAPTRGPATLSRQHLNRWDRVYVNAHHLRFVKVFSFPPR